MIVIGAGRVGTGLRDAAVAAGVSCSLVSRVSGWEALDEVLGVPVLVAVRNDDLEVVLERVPAHRRPDLVFIQNGMVRPWLRSHALVGATRGLLFFAVPTRGAAIEPGGASPFCGPRAAHVVHWLGQLGVPAQEVDWARFSAAELEKLIWNSAFGLLCQVHDADVGTVVTEHRGELGDLVRELAAVGRAAMGVELPHDYLMDRLCDYSASIPTYKGSVKEWRWRNGWFDQVAARYRRQTPVHRSMLQGIGFGDRLALVDV